MSIPIGSASRIYTSLHNYSKNTKILFQLWLGQQDLCILFLKSNSFLRKKKVFLTEEGRGSGQLPRASWVGSKALSRISSNVTSHSGIQLDCQRREKRQGNRKFFLAPLSAAGDTVDLYFWKLLSCLLCGWLILTLLPEGNTVQCCSSCSYLPVCLSKRLPLVLALSAAHTTFPWRSSNSPHENLNFMFSAPYMTFTVETPDIISTQHSQNKTIFTWKRSSYPTSVSLLKATAAITVI